MFLKPQRTGKRSQHAIERCRNIVWRNMLRPFGHRVATCCDMLGVVGSNLKMVKFEPTTPNMSQHVAPNNVATSCVGMLRSFGRSLTGVEFHVLPCVLVCFLVEFGLLFAFSVLSLDCASLCIYVHEHDRLCFLMSTAETAVFDCIC